jgi:hypothetical protein
MLAVVAVIAPVGAGPRPQRRPLVRGDANGGGGDGGPDGGDPSAAAGGGRGTWP